MDNLFTYTTLQYVHSNILDERVNVGLLLYFPNQANPFSFVYPKNIQRIKGLYPEIDLKKIHLYLKSIEESINSINQSVKSTFLNHDIDIYRLIDSEVLKNDDSAFKFSVLRSSILYSENTETIINDIYFEYFSSYEQKELVHNINEHQISVKYLNLLRSKSPGIESKIKKDYVIKKNDFDFSFDYAWQNGTLNLVKPIVFDLKDAKNIQQKSVLWFGNLSLLKQVADERNIRFDLLIAEPKNKNVFKEYDNALKTIDSAPVNKEIIELKDIELYTDRTIKYLTAI